MNMVYGIYYLFLHVDVVVCFKILYKSFERTRYIVCFLIFFRGMCLMNRLYHFVFTCRRGCLF